MPAAYPEDAASLGIGDVAGWTGLDSPAPSFTLRLPLTRSKALRQKGKDVLTQQNTSPSARGKAERESKICGYEKSNGIFRVDFTKRGRLGGLSTLDGDDAQKGRVSLG